MAKKKAVHKSKASTRKAVEAKGNEAIEQRAGTGEAAELEGAVTKETKKKRPVRCIQRHTDVEFRREFPKVFKALVNKAKKGGTAETRLLLQIGKFGDPKTAKRRGGKSLGEMLMDELKRRQDEREAAADSAKAEEQANETGSNETGSEGATSGGDAENG